MEVLAALTVTNQNPCRSCSLKHFARYLARVRALFAPKQVLSADLNRGPLDSIDRCGNSDTSRKDNYLAVIDTVDQRLECLKKCRGLLGGLVHLPVARHNMPSHTR